MNVNHEIIRETVTKLLKNNNSDHISQYINNAITSHRQALPTIKPAIEIQTQFVYIFYAEPNTSMIELIGFEVKDTLLRKEKKIRAVVEKDSKTIEDLLITLYTNIASNIYI